MGLRDNSVKYNFLTIGLEVLLRLLFFNRYGTPAIVFKPVKHLEIQTDNLLSLLGSAFCSCETMIDLHNTTFLPKSVGIPFYGTLFRPRHEYGMPSCSPSLVHGATN